MCLRSAPLVAVLLPLCTGDEAAGSSLPFLVALLSPRHSGRTELPPAGGGSVPEEGFPTLGDGPCHSAGVAGVYLGACSRMAVTCWHGAGREDSSAGSCRWNN